jgi:signal transduction histidine kinase
MHLSRRLALLTAVLAVVLILGATEVAVRWSERTRFADRRDDSIALAESWSAYLTGASPGLDSATVNDLLADWPGRHLAVSSAAVFRGPVAGLALVASSDTQALGTPAANTARALRERHTVVWHVDGGAAAWHVATPVGKPARGVLEVAVSTAPLSDWARRERLHAYPLAALAALLVALGVWFLTRWWVMRPLEAIAGAMEQAHGGVAGAPPAPEVGAQEFRQLARRYNALRSALADRQRESEARGELLALEERAKTLDRLALVDEMSAGFAHEIGTPLNTVGGHLQLLRDDLAGSAPSAALDRIQLLLGQVDRLARIVRAQLDRGSWPAPQPRPTDLREVGERMLRFLEPTLVRAGIGGRVEAAEPVVAWCDPQMLEQVLLNLLKNAVEAMPRGGEVVLRPALGGGRALLDVLDSGPGLAPVMQQQLFNPFATSRAGKGGTGLGLAVSRRLARTMGGDLEYLPTASGTAWRLSLPVKVSHA